MMDRYSCLEHFASLRTEELAVTHMGVAATEWLTITEDRERTFYMKSSMGMVSTFSIGMALSLPQRKVWAFDGDGSFIMNFGSLLTMASVQPKNMHYFVLRNNAYESAGGQPIVNIEQTDLIAMAKAAGIRHAYEFDDIEVLRKEVGAIVAKDDFTFVVLDVEKASRKYTVAPTDPIEITYNLGRYLERTEGITILR